MIARNSNNNKLLQNILNININFGAYILSMKRKYHWDVFIVHKF